MPDTTDRTTEAQEAPESVHGPRVRVYAGPTHRWILLARQDLTQQQAETYAAHHTGTMPDVSVTEVIGPTCLRCELTFAEAPLTCQG